MLYVFAGFPRNGLHAGGLQVCIEEVEELAILEHSPSIHYRKEGVFSGDNLEAEWLYDVDYHISDQCIRDGITWDWFPENFGFGNGVSIFKSVAGPDYKTVIQGTDLDEDEYLQVSGPTRMGDLIKERKHTRHNGWLQYEARWLPGTCPQENHEVLITCLVTTHKIPPFVYDRLKGLIEDGAGLISPHLYSSEQGKHFSTLRIYNGKPSHGARR